MNPGWGITDNHGTGELASRFPKLFLSVFSEQNLEPVPVVCHI